MSNKKPGESDFNKENHYNSRIGYKISFSKDNKIIIIEVLSEITIDIVRRWSVEVRDLSIEHNIDRYLFDTRKAPNIATTTENYKFAYREMNEIELSRSARSAILASPEDTSHDFVETLSRNAGFNVQVFTDKDKAIKWLTS